MPANNLLSKVYSIRTLFCVFVNVRLIITEHLTSTPISNFRYNSFKSKKKSCCISSVYYKNTVTMIIKLEKIISCTSEDPAYPASNLLQQRSNSSWRCAKPGEMLASVIIKLREPSCITGMDIGNYRSCIVVVTASTSAEPDNWIPIINHQFLTHDEAANGKFRDQVQLFTKKELNADTLKIKFDRVKITCMQSANLRETFGLSFIVMRTEVVVDLGVDVFARFKLKNNESTVDDLKDKYMKFLPNKKPGYKDELAEKIKEVAASKFARKQLKGAKKDEDNKTVAEDNTGSKEADDSNKNGESSSGSRKIDDDKKIMGEVSSKEETSVSKAKNVTPVSRTPFGDVINTESDKKHQKNGKFPSKKRSLYYEDSSDDEETIKDKSNCTKCAKVSQDRLCDTCKQLPPQKPVKIAPPPVKKAKVSKPRKEFSKLFENVKFALSGYQNPQRDEIRRKALKMGGKYVADPNTTNNKCTHLICAFSKTPKSQQLKGHTKIVSHKFIEECFDKKMRFPWRRFALDKKEKEPSESEEEMEAGTSTPSPPDPYQQDTDSDSNY